MQKRLAEPSIAFVSRSWFYRYLTSADPGPITQNDFLCDHGEGINYTTTPYPQSLVYVLPLGLYEDLVNKFGTVGYENRSLKNKSANNTEDRSNHLNEEAIDCLIPCLECQHQEAALEDRRKEEASTVASLDTVKLKAGENWYIISARWLASWHAFKSRQAQPPGPIDNSFLVNEKGEGTRNMRKSE